MNKPEIIVISSVFPLQTSAGELVLYRHLSGLLDWTVRIIPHPYDAKSLSYTVKLLKRLERTRFNRLVNDLAVIANGRSWHKSRELTKLRNSRTVVLTVAHGDGCWAALRFAKNHSLPLVTIFHDWWPDCPRVHCPFRKLLEHRFRKLYRESTVALCVSQAMKEHLGDHPNSVVLYPIPASIEKDSSSSGLVTQYSDETIKVGYSGGLYDYGPMLADLLRATKDHPHINLKVRGKRPNWPAKFQAEMKDRGLWLDFAPRQELESWLHSMDVLLVAMSFEPAMRRRMETSFSSKLLEYVQFGKPILIWGPEHCSAVAWAKQGDKALSVTDKSADAVIANLCQLRQFPEKVQYYAARSRNSALDDFSPINIQRQFVSTIHSL